MSVSSLLLAACGGSSEAEYEASPQATSAQEAPAESAEIMTTTYTWSKVADEWQTFTVAPSTDVRYGTGKSWVYKQLSGTVSCTNKFFGTDPAPGAAWASRLRRWRLRIGH